MRARTKGILSPRQYLANMLAGQERYAHDFPGVAIFLSGAAIQFPGLQPISLLEHQPGTVTNNW